MIRFVLSLSLCVSPFWAGGKCKFLLGPVSSLWRYIGEHDDHPRHGQRRKGGPDRVEDAEGTADGGDPGSKAKRAGGETGAEEVEIGTS